MDLSEYIDAVTGQMRCKRARAMVAKELTDHIEDQRQAYIEDGMEASEAEAEAVRQMGDAVEVGTQMDAIHRPGMDKELLILVGIFSIAAVFVQNMVFVSMNVEGALFPDRFKSLAEVGIGLLIMLGVLFLDYTILGKKPIHVWVVLFMLLPLWLGSDACSLLPSFGSRLIRYALFALMLPAYGGVIYHMLKKGWKGLFGCVALLGLAGILCKSCVPGIFILLMLCTACLLLLTYAVAKGWFGVPRIPALAVVCLLIVGGGGAVIGYIFQYGEAYQAARLRAFVQVSGDSSYITKGMRDILDNLNFIGSGNGSWDLPCGTYTAFLMIAQKIGILAAILVVAGFLVLFIVMAAGISKQKNVLGGLTGMACLLGLLMPTVCHILSNLTLIPFADCYIPFLYPGLIVNASCYMLLGLYLSVYRYTDVVA